MAPRAGRTGPSACRPAAVRGATCRCRSWRPCPAGRGAASSRSPWPRIRRAGRPRSEVGDGLERLDPFGAVVADLALDRALDERQRVAGTLRDHRQEPHDQQRVEGGVPAHGGRAARRRAPPTASPSPSGRRSSSGPRDPPDRAAPCCSTGPWSGRPCSGRGGRLASSSRRARRDGTSLGHPGEHRRPSAGRAPRSASRPSRVHARTNRPSIITSPTGSPDSSVGAREPVPVGAEARDAPGCPTRCRGSGP